ncbi:hypothetical protein SDC9_114358 [bioreactor metagenome]|uniref:Uncharacterized protein n=1 Tax=bioreactor metagenome TaxID=1076179 RepID=A0A645BPX9_9ZZZZ
MLVNVICQKFRLSISGSTAHTKKRAIYNDISPRFFSEFNHTFRQSTGKPQVIMRMQSYFDIFIQKRIYLPENMH